MRKAIEILSEITSKEELVAYVIEMSILDLKRFLFVVEMGDSWNFITWMDSYSSIKWKYDSFDWKEVEKILEFVDNNNKVYKLETDNDTYNLFSCDNEFIIDLMNVMGIEFNYFDRSELE